MGMMFEMMEERGIKLNLDLSPKTCERNSDCPMMYRDGGCCARMEVTKGAEVLSKDDQAMFKSQSATGGLCMMGPGVEIMEKNGGGFDTYDYARELYQEDAFTRHVWG
jgi:hypothetical protein